MQLHSSQLQTHCLKALCTLDNFSVLAGDNILSAFLSPSTNSVIPFSPQMSDPFKGLEKERQRARPRAITSICHPLGPSEGDSHGKRGDE